MFTWGEAKRALSLAVATWLWLAAGAAWVHGQEAGDDRGVIADWADSRLSYTDGMLVWLDAAAIPAARAAEGLAPLTGGDPIGEWANGVSGRPPLQQPDMDAQPSYQPADDFHSIHFSGEGQYLRLAEPLPAQQSLTVFIVAAPYSTPHPFSAFLSLSESGKNDFQTGLNIDQAAGSAIGLETVNVEGAGSQGAQNLLKAAAPFGSVVRLCVTSKPGAGGVSLWRDGELQGVRDRDPAAQKLTPDELLVGARYYGFGSAPHAQGFLHGDIAEVLIFDHRLSGKDRASVDRYLEMKYGQVPRRTVPGDTAGGEPLERVEDAVPVQIFVPGFSAYELPLKLTNINNVQYREDGTLIALGYDGRIWKLRDADGDGIEDTADLFWSNKRGVRSPIGMDLTPRGYAHGDGVFLASKTECLLVVDTDGDDVADREIQVAGGWRESFHGVDGLGVALDPEDGSVYFGRGTHNFTDPFLRDQDGRSQYSRDTESGVILRVSPDFQHREIFATGIRFPVAIRFNRNGDLFCTDQEGATWVPNGNPLDELLHVREGRHYGFPARHPHDLPDVIDEPSTFDYGPQHQSTCGFCFNDPVGEAGNVFGPAAWEGDALVTGYARGKLYRTQVARTPAGYVARNHLFACLNMLTADCCVAPDGALVVACHSGGPDWGSGPTGEGKLYKLRYTDQNLPQPSLAWPASARELRIEFDRPVDPELLRDVLEQTEITGGEYVRPGDRFETLWPGYAAVMAQQQAPRHAVAVHSAQLTADRQTLVLATDPMRAAVHYAVRLPGLGRPAKQSPPAGTLPQYPQVDLGFDLSGVQATWSREGQIVWQGQLPCFDLDLARRWTAGSASHEPLWQAMEEPGELVLEAQLDLVDMLRPAVQPGSKIDYQLPPERVRLSYASSGVVEVVASDAPSSGSRIKGGTDSLEFSPTRGQLLPVRFRIERRAGAAPLDFSLSYATAEDVSPRPLPLHRSLVPWAQTSSGASTADPLPLPEELRGGSWARGRKVFHGAATGCGKCHAVDRQGGAIGPDLSNLIHRDYASVLRDITQPNFAINPDYIASSLLLSDGRILHGMARSEGDTIAVADQTGEIQRVAQADVEQIQTSSVSVMPEGVLKTLSADQTRDLMTFLLTPAPSMPRDYPGEQRRERRTVAEVSDLLSGAPEPPLPTRPIRVVLVAGPKDHGPGEHDYPAWQEAWSELLSAADDVTVDTAWEWPGEAQFKTADVIVFYQHGDWDSTRAGHVDQFLKRGGGLVYIHWAVDGRKHGDGFAERIGLAARGMVGFRHGELQLEMNASAEHPVLRNFSRLALTDESYWKLAGELPPERALATSDEEGAPQPQVWSLERANGRVFVSIPGHYSWTFDDPAFRVLLLRGIAWAAKEPVDRFNQLVWPGAEVAE